MTNEDLEKALRYIREGVEKVNETIEELKKEIKKKS